MAFRILNEEEILLLTDKQRENYENELEVHCQRAAFVEKLTEIEKAEIKEYKPSLHSVFVIKERPSAFFTKPEPTNFNFKRLVKPELPLKLYGKSDIKIDLSEIINKADVTKGGSKLNNISSLTTKTSGFIKYEPRRYNVTKFSKPTVPNRNFIQVYTVLQEHVKFKTPLNIKNFKPFNTSVQTKVVLSNISKPCKIERSFVKPDKPKFNNKTNNRHDIHIKNFKMPEFKLKAYSDIYKPNIKIDDFKLIKINKPEFEINVTSNINFRSFKMPETVLENMSGVFIPKVEIKGFQPPAKPAPSITVNAGAANIKPFSIPELAEAKLPEIKKIRFKHHRFSKPDICKFSVNTNIANNVNIKTFEKLQTVKPKMSEISKPEIKMKNFLKIQNTDVKISAQVKPAAAVRTINSFKNAKPTFADIIIPKKYAELDVGEIIKQFKEL